MSMWVMNSREEFCSEESDSTIGQCRNAARLTVERIAHLHNDVRQNSEHFSHATNWPYQRHDAIRQSHVARNVNNWRTEVVSEKQPSWGLKMESLTHRCRRSGVLLETERTLGQAMDIIVVVHMKKAIFRVELEDKKDCSAAVAGVVRAHQTKQYRLTQNYCRTSKAGTKLRQSQTKGQPATRNQ